jgi:hypothetical protein
MSILTLVQEGDWIRLYGPSTPAFTNFLKYGIKPQSYRMYDPDKRQWLVHWTKLDHTVRTARLQFDHVDWSRLPDNWQMLAVGASGTTASPVQDIPPSPYAILHVTEDAPTPVIRAAYKALCKLHHPDVGGSHEVLTRINLALEQILSARKSE